MSNDYGPLDLGGVDLGNLAHNQDTEVVAPQNIKKGRDLELGETHSMSDTDHFSAINALDDMALNASDRNENFYGFSDPKKRMLALGLISVISILGFLFFEDEIDSLLFENPLIREEIVDGVDIPSVTESQAKKSENAQSEFQEVTFLDLKNNQIFNQNPYWFIENNIDIKNPNKDMLMLPPTLEQEWRQELQHRYFNIRSNTLREIRDAKMKGSEIILYNSLDQPKLWLRMEALFGLADMGVEFNLATAQRALANSRESLQRNYLKRYNKKLSKSEQYSHRQLLKIASGPVRVQLLQNLLGNKEPINAIFVQAARFDSYPAVQRWFGKSVGQNSLRTGTLSEYRKAIELGYNAQLNTVEDSMADTEDNLRQINKDVSASYNNIEFSSDSSQQTEQDEIDERTSIENDDGFDSLGGDANSEELAPEYDDYF